MRILFMGRKPAGAAALEWTLGQGHEVVGVLTDSHLEGSATAAVAERHGVPLFTYETASEALRAGEMTFDLGVSFVYWRILKSDLLMHPPLGIINFHPAPLPEYKGTGGYNLAILNALDTWAVTAHYMDAGIDTGGIIEVAEFAIDRDRETARTLEATSMAKLLELYRRTVARVTCEQRLATRPNVGGRYVSRSEMEAMKQIVPGDDVDRKIRAFWFPPYRGAWIEVEGRPFTLVNEAILESLAGEGVTHLHKPHRTGPQIRDALSVEGG